MSKTGLLPHPPGDVRWRVASLGAAVTALSLAACSGGSGGSALPTVARSASPNVPSTPASAPGTALAVSSSGTADASVEVIGAVVRFSAESTSVEVTIVEGNTAVRDFVSMLPLSLTLEEFAGREKIAYLPRELAHEGSAGSDPEDGDLIYYVPWGNIGFYYNTAGIGYSEDTLHLGTYEASLDELDQLEGQDVTVEVVWP